jgi:phosphoribosylglycinamide formyltransferase 1
MKKKFGFYVSRTATRLCHFLEKYGNLDKCAFVLIDNKDNERLRSLCSKYSIPYYEYAYKEEGLKGKEQNRFISDKFKDLMDNYEVEYSFIFGSRILEGELLQKYQWHLVNFHPALLPAFKGKCAIDQAIEAGAILLGSTAHFIDEELDAGLMIMQNIFPAVHFTDYEDVLGKQETMLLQLMTWFEQDRVHIENNRVVVTNASYEIAEYIPNVELTNV